MQCANICYRVFLLFFFLALSHFIFCRQFVVHKYYEIISADKLITVGIMAAFVEK